ncbi:MAG: hypothetical protein PHF44_04575 [Candidatus Pacebacteria bacterium]|nr:hypothetical protein [Candidatus Paceibacterota bacterium]
MNNCPYISFVIAARNDDYGGNFLHRIQIFVNVLSELCEKYSLNSELIIVDWNPPITKESLVKVLSWPKNRKAILVRFIEVPSEIHKLFPKSDKMPMFEFIAKNVGIRRADGEYIIVTNPDIIFSEDLIKFLALKKLSKESFYRVNRYDLEKIIPLDATTDEQLIFCEKNWTGVKTLNGDLKKKFPYFTNGYFFSLLSRFKAKLIYDPRPKIHTNASGDFFLMANSQWRKLRGYPELPIPCFVDSYVCFIAASSGLSQVILGGRKRIYHQGHKSYVNRANFYDEYKIFKNCAKEMMKYKKPLIVNKDDWGLEEESLKEYCFN